MCVYIFRGGTLWSQYLAHTTELHAPRESVVEECACPVSGKWRALARAPQELHIANGDGDNDDEDDLLYCSEESVAYCLCTEPARFSTEPRKTN